MKRTTKKICAIAAMFALSVSCVGLGAVTAFAETTPEDGVAETLISSVDFGIRGGSIRYDSGANDNGMRIHIRMNEETYNNLGEKEVGVLIIPEYDLGGAVLNYETDEVLNVSFATSDWVAIEDPNTASGEAATDKEIITDLIYQQNGAAVSSKLYNATFVVRGYIKDGEEIAYTDVWTKSIADIALYFLADENESAHWDELNDYINTYSVKFYDNNDNQIGETQSVKYGSEFTVPEANVTVDDTQYVEWRRMNSNGEYATEEYDFDVAGAKVVKKNAIFKTVAVDRKVTFGENISVKDANGQAVESGDAVALGTYTVTIQDSDKTKMTTLFANGESTNFYVVNGASSFEYTITEDEQTEFTLVQEDMPITFFALSNSFTEDINAREQGINEDGYLVGPNFDQFSATSPITLSKDAVFTTTMKMNRGYNFGVRFLIGETEYRLLARPNFRIDGVSEFRPGWMEIWKGTSPTRYILTDEILDDEVDIKLIFDSANEKVYAFVNGQDFTSQLGVTYTSADTAKLHFYYLCEKDQEAALYKDWSVLSGREAVEEAVSEINTTYAGTKKLVGEVNIQANGLETESTLFEATITATGNNYKAGLYFADYSTGKTDVGIYVTKDKIYGGENKNYSIDSSLTHTLKINYRSDGALMVYVDGVLKTGQFMTGFTTSATKFAKFTCYVVNEGSDIATIDYHFANERKVNSDNLAYTTYTEGYNVSMEKIGELNLKSAVANDEGKYESFATTVKVPTSGFAGIMIKDDKGNYIVYGIVNNSQVRIFKPGATPPHDSFRGATFAEKNITADGEYDLLFQIENRRALKFYADLKTISTQFMDSAGGATNCGFATDATKLEIYLVWFDANTQFVY